MATKNNNLLPVASVAELEKLDALKYLTGMPRSYRFNAKSGTLMIVSMSGTEAVTKKGASVELLHIGHRIFSGEILNYSRRKWLELFFVNRAGQVGSFMVHGSSVENFEQLRGELFYSEATTEEIALTLTPVLRKGKKGDYYVAEFSYEVLSSDEKERRDAIINTLDGELYRDESARWEVDVVATFNVAQPYRLNGDEPAALPEATEA